MVVELSSEVMTILQFPISMPTSIIQKILDEWELCIIIALRLVNALILIWLNMSLNTPVIRTLFHK